MKYAIIIPDGCADEPQESLDGKTPLEAAQIPNMDAVVQAGVVGRSNNVPPNLPAGSDVATLSLLGYDPLAHFTGRAPMEAAANGIELGPEDWAIRCNLVNVENQVMQSFTAGHISSEEARTLIELAQESLGSDQLQFMPGVSYRNLLIFRDTDGHRAPFSADTRSTPPHDLTDKTVLEDYPRGPGSDLLLKLMNDSVALFDNHPVNQARAAAGKPTASNIWLWGQGKQPNLPQFAELHQVQGAMITAVDLLRGIAALIGWQRIEVPGATGYTDTDYAAKGRYAIEALKDVDLICVHVEATDEASHEGDAAAKIAALEAIDQQIVGPLHDALKTQGDYRILISPDHPTPIRTKTHSHGFVPWAIAGTGIGADSAASYDEPTAQRSAQSYDAGWQMMSYFLNSHA